MIKAVVERWWCLACRYAIIGVFKNEMTVKTFDVPMLFHWFFQHVLHLRFMCLLPTSISLSL